MAGGAELQGGGEFARLREPAMKTSKVQQSTTAPMKWSGTAEGLCGHSSPFGSLLSFFFFKLLAMLYLAKMDFLHFYPVRVDHGEFFILLEPRGER